jgi:protein gp37
MTLAKRLKAMGSEKYQNDGDPRTSGPGFDVTVHPQTLDEPYRWRQPRVVFVNSMSDLSAGVSSIIGVISTGQRRCLRDRQVSHTAPIGLAA